MTRIKVLYATTSEFKRDEVLAALDSVKFKDSDNVERLIGDRFTFEFSNVKTDEPLEIDLDAMVKHKVVSAYRRLLTPCIVEHAGIILVRHLASGFPGGLTQPMWNALGPEDFLTRTGASGERAVARAVFGYCDGMNVATFSGESRGTLSDGPRGRREFYWDTIFCPDDCGGKTYAEISEQPHTGLKAKVQISQSFKALRALLEALVSRGHGELFADWS